MNSGLGSFSGQSTYLLLLFPPFLCGGADGFIMNLSRTRENNAAGPQMKLPLDSSKSRGI